MKIKIGLKKSLIEEASEPIAIPQPEPIRQEQTIEKSVEDNADSDLKNYIREFHLKPLKELIKNEGVYNDCLIANTDALLVIKKIIVAIIKQKNLSITDILEKAAFEEEPIEIEKSDASVEVAEPEVEASAEILIEDEAEEIEDEAEEEDEEEEEEEYYDEQDLEEARECDSYCYEEDESMDG